MKKGTQQTAKHKPNTRHTLNEVLHSLQDMMHNELADVDLPTAANTDADRSRTREDALNNLRALIGSQPPAALEPDNPGNATDNMTPADTHTPSDTDIEEIELSVDDDMLDDYPDIELGEPVPDDSPDSTGAITDDGAVAEEPPAVEDFALEMEDANQPATRTDNRKTDTPEPATKKGKRARTPAKSAEQVEINWDDIPVLNDVVAPPPTPDDVTSRQAREIAIKVAAALNIEMKKQGTGEMDIKTIMRLQSLLGRELAEQGGSLEPESGGESDQHRENRGTKDADPDDDA
jgi:hypothetical protein